MSFLKSRRLGLFLSRAAKVFSEVAPHKSFLKSRRLSLFLSRAA